MNKGPITIATAQGRISADVRSNGQEIRNIMRRARSGGVLRGGCFHNWVVHCTVSKRYQIERQYHDGCIGFRVVMAET